MRKLRLLHLHAFAARPILGQNEALLIKNSPFEEINNLLGISSTSWNENFTQRTQWDAHGRMKQGQNRGLGLFGLESLHLSQLNNSKSATYGKKKIRISAFLCFVRAYCVWKQRRNNPNYFPNILLLVLLYQISLLVFGTDAERFVLNRMLDSSTCL